MFCNRIHASRLVSVGVLSIVMLALVVPRLFPQSQSGTLRGVVRDSSGGVIPGASVTATNDGTSETRSMISTADGVFNFPTLLPGSYTVTVEMEGFNKWLRRAVEVKANQVTDLTALMELGQVATVLEVTAGSDLVQTTTSQAGGSIPDKAVQELPNPTLDASPLNLALSFPNVVSQPGGVLGEGGAVGGNRPRNNNFTIDGVDNNDVSITGPQAPVIQDAVSEFNLLTNQFSAEFGHSTAGQFNIITKSGTNDLHGSAFWFGQNKNLNAYDNIQKAAIAQRRESGLPDKPRYDFSRAGGSIGGPIVRDKLFFFGAYQYQTEGQEATGVTVLAPTAPGLQALQSLAANGAVNSILAQTPTATAATDEIVVNGQSIPVGPFQAFAPDFFNQHDFQINGDWNAGAHQLRGRFLYDRYRAPNINPDLPLAQFSGAESEDHRKIAFTDAWTISSRWVNDFRLSYSRFVQSFTVPSEFANFPNVTIGDLGLNIGPESNSPQSSVQNTYQVLNNVAYTRGAHAFKFGVEYRNWIAPSNFLPRERGEFGYLDFQELVSDLIPTGLNGALRGAGSGFFAGNQQAVYWFVQDDFKATPRLTLNLGLRYEYTTNPRDAALQELNSIATVPGLFEFRKPKTDTNNFAPRIGLAYDPFGDGRTSIRAGFSLAYDTVFQNLHVLQLPPQLQTEQNPELTCSLPNAPAWCPTGVGFLGGGGLVSVNVPPTTAEEARSATQAIIVDQRMPKTFSWMLSVEREFLRNYRVELRYMGTRGLNLPIQVRLNALSVFERNPDLLLPTFFSTSEVPATFPAEAPTLADIEDAQDLRFSDLGFDGGFITAFEPVGRSTYHGGSIDVTRRLSHRIYFKGNYTFSKTIDNSTNELFSSRVNPRRPQDSFNLRDERGLSVLDKPHHFTLGWMYELPTPDFGNSLVRGVLGGWQINGNYLAESGQPITPLSGVDANADLDTAADRALVNPNADALRGTDVFFIQRGVSNATSLCDPALTDCASATTVGYVAKDPGARFVVAQVGTRPNAGRNIIRTAGINNWNLSFFKNTYLTESKYVQLRFEMFNAFNHRQPTIGNGSVFQQLVPNNALSTTFANVSSPLFLDTSQFTGGSRNIQLSLKFIF
jgi:hypothetical protein